MTKERQVKKYSLKTNAVFNALYQILALLAPLLTTPYISRILGSELIGDYAYFYSIVSFFLLVATFGFTDYGTKKIAEVRNNKAERSNVFWGIMSAKGILSLISITGYIIFCLISYRGSSNLLVALTMAFYPLSTLIDPIFYFQGEENFVSISLRNSFIRILTIVLIFTLVKSQNDFIYYVLILAGGNFVATGIMYFSFKGAVFGPQKSKILVFKYLKESFPFFVPTLAVTLFGQLNQTLLGIIGNSASENGYFAQGMKFINILTGLVGSLSIIMLSRISYLTAEKNDNEIKQKIKKTFDVFWSISFACTFGIAAINKQLIPVFLGDGYDKVIPVLYILCPIIIFSPLNNLYGNLYFRPKNKIWIQTYIIIFVALLNIILNLLLIPRFGSIGCAISSLVTEALQFPLLAYYAKEEIDIRQVLKSAIEPFDCGLITFMAVYASGEVINGKISSLLEVLVLIVIGILFYGIFGLLFKDPLIIFAKETILKAISKIKNIFNKKPKKSI